ncbi:MAG TPA: hypothetical protein VKP14_07005 [Gaiellaceae bacterium]|nr:hypothetical protein [Gaiellaceae bacterium]
MEAPVAFRMRDQERSALEVRINFGLFAARGATPAEIDDLARALKDVLPSFEIVAEERHEFGGAVEASVHQVVIHADEPDDDTAVRIVQAAERWAEACFASRHSDIADV